MQARHLEETILFAKLSTYDERSARLAGVFAAAVFGGMVEPAARRLLAGFAGTSVLGRVLLMLNL